MTQDLDIEKWQEKHKDKQTDFHTHTTNVSQKKYAINHDDDGIQVKDYKGNPSSAVNLSPNHIKAMEDHDIIDVLTSKPKHRISLLIMRIVFTLFCTFFISMALFIVFSEKQIAGILFVIVPLFMLRQVFRSPKKRHILFGSTHFYYPYLLNRAIAYSEIQDFQIIKKETSNMRKNQPGSERTLLHIRFYESVDESDLGPEARMIKYRLHSNEDTSYDLYFFPLPFDVEQLQTKLKQYIG